MNLFCRLWDMSPREITCAVLRSVGLIPSSDPPPLEWHRVASGPLAGAELYLAPEAVDTWRAMVAGTHDRHLFEAVASCRPPDGVTGRAVPPHDPAALREAVEGFIADPALSRQVGEAARRHVLATFTWDQAARRGLEFYHHFRPGWSQSQDPVCMASSEN